MVGTFHNAAGKTGNNFYENEAFLIILVWIYTSIP